MLRIAISGKGGSGKTTLAGALSRLLSRRRPGVLAVDGDPNPNLGRTLGVAADAPLSPLPADLLGVEERDGRRVAVLQRPIGEILATHSVPAPDGVRLLSLGAVEKAGQGCLCRGHGVVREIVGAALQETHTAPVVFDMEASLEHMSRGTVRHVDVLLVVTEPYFRSLESAKRLLGLARDVGVPKILGVANKVRTAAEEEAVRSYCRQIDLPLVSLIPFDDGIGAADLRGLPALDLEPDTAAIRAIDALAAHLIELGEQQPAKAEEEPA